MTEYSDLFLIVTLLRPPQRWILRTTKSFWHNPNGEVCAQTLHFSGATPAAICCGIPHAAPSMGGRWRQSADSASREQTLGGSRRELDASYPRGAVPRPLALLIHSGGF